MVATAIQEVPKEVIDLNKLMNDLDLSLASTARSIGCSTGALSKVRKGNYEAEPDKILKLIRQFLQLQKDRREVLPRAPFVETSVTRKVLRACRVAHVEKEMVLLAGQSGIGKTMSLRKYALENKTAIYIVANAACNMHMTMYRIAQMSEASVRGNTAEIADCIVRRLKGTNRVLIVDEADHLNFNAIEMVRYIHDEAGIGVVLSGWQDMLHEITGGGTGEGKYSRVYTRCGMVEHLKPLRKSDVKKIADAVLGEAKPEIVDKLFEVSRGCARTVVKLLPRAWKAAKSTNNGRLTPAIIEETKRQLLMV